MCGFIGLTKNNQSNLKIEEFKGILGHRGPDNVSVLDLGNIAFVHNRLSIIDLTKKADQPMVDPATGNAIVFNGEIYNFKELKEEYKNISWTTQSDTEVVLKLYGHIGKGFVDKLNGIFAFAIYDKKKNKALLYRDRFGVKPLYFSEAGPGFIFASEIKAILKAQPKDINKQAVYDYLEFGQLAHNNETFFEGIYQLEPAHFLEYDLSTRNINKSRYWDVNSNAYPSSPGEREASDEALRILRDSMRLNMVSDVEVAVSLSSGTDSTLILKLAQEYSKRIKAFTFGFEEKEYDEVRRILKQGLLGDIDLHPVYLSRSQMLPKLKEALYYFEGPMGGVGTLSAYNMMKEVHRHGIKVMLAGEGSDEVFGGYQYYYPAFFKDIAGEPRLLEEEIRAYSALHGHKDAASSGKHNEMLDLISRNIVLAPDGTGAGTSHVSEFLADAVCGKSPVLTREFPDNLRQVMYNDLTKNKLPKLLFFQDRAGMASSVETRVPYLDHRLVSFLYSLDGKFKIRGGQNKYLVKKILEDTYGYVEARAKHYVATPQREWLKSKPVLSEILDTVKGGELVNRNLIDYGRFERDYIAYAASPDLGNSFFAWKIINLEYLLRAKI